ncbi:hypothetical protein NL676_034282 [Syzygium grande]|nr:hypothetical protein NL676_034282 [Syzygium grande]
MFRQCPLDERGHSGQAGWFVCNHHDSDGIVGALLMEGVWPELAPDGGPQARSPVMAQRSQICHRQDDEIHVHFFLIDQKRERA